MDKTLYVGHWSVQFYTSEIRFYWQISSSQAYHICMNVPKIVIDTNVLIAALRSRRGASCKLLSLIGNRTFDVAVFVPLLFEYEEVAFRQSWQIWHSCRHIKGVFAMYRSIAMSAISVYLPKNSLHTKVKEVALKKSSRSSLLLNISTLSMLPGK